MRVSMKSRSVALAGCVVVAALGVGGYATSAAFSKQESSAKGVSRAETAVVKADIAEYHTLLGTTPRLIGSGSLAVPALKKQPSRKTVYGIVTCTLPSCAPFTQGAQAAAKELGWRTVTVTTPLTPQGWGSSIEQLIQKKVNVIITPGIAPTAEVLPQMEQAKKQGVLIEGYGITDKRAGGSSPIGYEVITPSSWAAMGAGAAYTAVGLQNGPPAVAVLTDPTIPAFISETAKVKQIIGAAGGSVHVLNVSSANIGSSVPSQLVAFLQANPSIKYVLTSDGDFMAGVPEALKAAGLTDIKVIGASSNSESLPLVKDGQMTANVMTAINIDGWRLVYAAAQILTGSHPDPNPNEPVAVADRANAAGFGDVSTWPQSILNAYKRALK
jgi:ribose transport system substrate-binding protein